MSWDPSGEKKRVTWDLEAGQSRARWAAKTMDLVCLQHREKARVSDEGSSPCVRLVGDENGKAGRNSTIWSPIGSGVEFGFYLCWGAMEGFKQEWYDMSFPGGSVGKESSSNAGDAGLIPGSRRSPGEGNGNPLQYSCLGNPLDRGAGQAAVHGARKESDTTATKQQCDAIWFNFFHFKLFLLHWGTANYQCCDSFRWTAKGLSRTYIQVSILPQTLLPSRLPHNTEQSSMSYTTVPCWLPILNTAVYTWPSRTP